MANTTFSGPVRSENGFQTVSKNASTGAITVTKTSGTGSSPTNMTPGAGIQTARVLSTKRQWLKTVI